LPGDKNSDQKAQRGWGKKFAGRIGGHILSKEEEKGLKKIF
jgi:hypothetical protein